VFSSMIFLLMFYLISVAPHRRRRAHRMGVHRRKLLTPRCFAQQSYRNFPERYPAGAKSVAISAILKRIIGNGLPKMLSDCNCLQKFRLASETGVVLPILEDCSTSSTRWFARSHPTTGQIALDFASTIDDRLSATWCRPTDCRAARSLASHNAIALGSTSMACAGSWLQTSNFWRR